jgi:hypothetical protein
MLLPVAKSLNTPRVTNTNILTLAISAPWSIYKQVFWGKSIHDIAMKLPDNMKDSDFGY